MQHAPGSGSPPVTDLVTRLTEVGDRADRLTHLEVLPARAATTAPWPGWVPAPVREAYAARGIDTLWRHQVEAAGHAHAGRHVVVSTGTASGKSLVFQLPALAAVHAGRGERGERGASVLYVAPTKALAQDQWAGLR
ncbi:MAG TPA: DEAD/DEAH box helicase, partial [Nocardioides sp.]|nr:DEAD/DEAH box helicase [Nocardioides sp.]